MQKQQEKPMNSARSFKIQGPVGIIFSSVNTGSWRYERPVVDFASCIKCKTCQAYCPVDAVDVLQDKAECVDINLEFCKGCGICANECPKKCIEMREEAGFNGI